jgi:uncharacterized protein YbcI
MENLTTNPAPGNSDGNQYESVRAEVSREMVRLYKELFGRGPTQAATHEKFTEIVDD